MKIQFKDLYPGKGATYWKRASFMIMWKKLPLTVQERLHWPNWEKAPWHLRVEVHGYGYNIWPHKGTWQRDDRKKVEAETFWLDLKQEIERQYEEEQRLQRSIR